MTRLGWWDKIAEDFHPDQINAVCDFIAVKAEQEILVEKV